MRVFISWSGDRSKAVAAATTEWLRNVNQKLDPWMSKQIPPGARWSQVIGTNLRSSRAGIVCVTPENVDAPWLVFEAGALSNKFGDARVIPLLVDLAPGDVTGPLNQFQALSFSKESMLQLAISINELLGARKVDDKVLEKAVADNWRTFSAKIEAARALPIASKSLRTVLNGLRRSGLPDPSEGRSLNFAEGFETHKLYDAVFSAARERVYIFGRKNRKVFDKDHDTFFKALPAKLADGFEFRCLFLNPAAPKSVITGAHADADFAKQLEAAVSAAKTRLKKHKLDPSQLCRYYSLHRPHAIIVIDDIILFAPTGLDTEGKPQPLTGHPFKLIDANDSFGRELIEHFNAVWNVGKPIAA